MRTCSPSIADKTIPKAKSNYIFIKAGKTQDIVDTILNEDKRAHLFTKDFAPHLRGANMYDTCRNIWNFVKCNIKYELDPFGKQFIKTPAQTWADKKADCKSYSIFVASLLKNLGIPYSYRFVSFNPLDNDVTHVYIVAHTGSGDLIIDGVLGAYNKEKKFTHKTDYKMTKIYVVQGAPQAGKLVLDKDIDQMTDGEMTLLIAKQALEIDKMNYEKAAAVAGIGATKYIRKAAKTDDQLDAVEDALDVVNNPNLSVDEKLAHLSGIADDAQDGIYGICCNGSISGPKDRKNFAVQRRGSRMSRVNMRMRNPHYVGAIGRTRFGKFLRKVSKGIKNVAKAVVNVATAPMRLAAKGIIEVGLPKAAPYFLYLFITDQAVINKLPAKVKRKRDKAQKIADFIVNTIGMKRDHFMAIVRNGISKRYGTSPEDVLSKRIKSISGIGMLPIPAGLITGVIEIIKKIASVFGKKVEEEPGEGDMPSDNDFYEMPAADRNDLGSSVKKQTEEEGEGYTGRRKGMC